MHFLDVVDDWKVQYAFPGLHLVKFIDKTDQPKPSRYFGPQRVRNRNSIGIGAINHCVDELLPVFDLQVFLKEKLDHDSEKKQKQERNYVADKQSGGHKKFLVVNQQ